MAKGKFKCSKCDRTFSMAAHLARHTKAIHGPKGRKKKVLRAKAAAGHPKRVARRAATRPKKRISWAGPASSSGTARILNEMQGYYGELVAQRTSLDSQISAVGQAIKVMGVAMPSALTRRGVKRGRPVATRARAGSLKDYIERVLRQRSKPLSPRNIGAIVIKAGFKTKAKDITKAVSNTLPQMKNIKKAGFGMYQLAGRAK